LPFGSDHFVNQRQNVGAENLVVTGYPVRPEFCEGGNESGETSIVESLGIEPTDKVMLIMMGAAGANPDRIRDDAWKLSHRLENVDGKVHIVVLCASNDVLRGEIQRIAGQDDKMANVTVHAVPRIDAAQMRALMERGDVMLTKPGGATVNEALAVNLPLLFRGNVHTLPWEAGNCDYVTQHRLGEWAENDGPLQLEAQAAKFLNRPRGERARVDAPAKAFSTNIVSLLNKITAKPAD